jgi:hypothetical protein
MQKTLAIFGMFPRQGEIEQQLDAVGSRSWAGLSDCGKGSKNLSTKRGGISTTWQEGCIC